MKRRPSKPTRKRRTGLQDKEARSTASHLVTIEKPVYGGAFLARMDGKAVFVPLTLPGEQAQVRITEDKGGYAKAEVDEIVVGAPIRIAPACKHFGVCGGCDYQHTDYKTQFKYKEAILRETLERGRVQPPSEIKVLAATDDRSWGYRNRIRVAIDAAGRPGYRGRSSHAIIPITECPIASPLLVRAAQTFAEVGGQFLSSLSPSEISLFCDGEERWLLARVHGGRTPNRGSDGFADLCSELARRIPELKGVDVVIERRAGERKTEQTSQKEANWGESSLVYGTSNFDYRVNQGAFFQINRWLVDGLVQCVASGQKGKLAWDLFAGVGLFARKLTESFAHVVAVESAPQCITALKENLRNSTGTAVESSTLDFLHRNRNVDLPDFIVVDPPRAGLGEAVTALLAGVGASQLVYVSCDPSTLTRDLRSLVGAGYAIESVVLADLFPQTFHLETVVHMRRS